MASMQNPKPQRLVLQIESAIEKQQARNPERWQKRDREVIREELQRDAYFELEKPARRDREERESKMVVVVCFGLFLFFFVLSRITFIPLWFCFCFVHSLKREVWFGLVCS